ncbi:MAG: AsmA family protein [Alphaproteobacteria bacterium]|nr:AsmA family protein [Alphaproteobacteria bacterium]MDA7988985.1 AsmA family protein [Alphaproteobacteria bacterium]MDA8009403.1 AsmA family protein [Alphaproteobacteria bacterium]
MKKALAVIAVAVVLVVAGAVFLAPRAVNWEIYKPVIASLLSERTGLDIQISGPLSLQMRPAPRFVMKFASVKNAGAGLSEISLNTADNIVSVNTVHVDFDIASLLVGQPRITVSLIDPTVAVERYREGNYNIENLMDKMFQSSQGLNSGPGQVERESGFTLETVNIIGGNLSFTDFDTGSTQEVFISDGVMILDVNRGVLSAEGDVVYQGASVAYDLLLSNTEAPETYALVGSIERGTEAASSLTIDLEGLIHLNPAVRVDVRAKARETYIPLSHEGAPLGERADGFWVELNAEAVWGERPRLAVNTLAAGHGALSPDSALVNGKGAVLSRADAPLKIDLTLDAANLDIAALQFEADRFLSAWMRPPGEDDGADPPVAAANFLGVPEASIHILVEALSYGGETFRRLRMNADFSDNRWSIADASVQLPGVTSLTLNGAIDGEGFVPKMTDGFTGRVALETSDLPAFLGWAGGARADGLDSPQASVEGALRLASLADGAGELRDLRLRALGSRLGGSLKWDDNSLRAEIRAQELDIGAWRALADALGSRTTGALESLVSTGVDDGAEEKEPRAITIDLSADAVRFGSRRGRGARLRAETGARGFWRIGDLRLDSFHGLRLLRGTGEIRVPQADESESESGVLVQDMFLDMEVIAPQEAAAAFGLGSRRASLLSGAQAGVRVDGALDSLRLSGKVSLAGGGLMEANAILSPAPAWSFRSEGFLQAADAREFFGAILGREAPNFVRGDLISDFALEMDASEGRLRLNGMRLGTFPMTAAVAWRHSPSLLIESRVQGGRLDLTRAADATATATDATNAVDIRGALERLPRAPIAAAPGVDLKVAANLETLILRGSQLEDVAFTLEVKDGAYLLSDGAATLDESPLTLSGSLTPGRGAWDGEMALSVGSVNLGKFLDEATGERVSGVVNLGGNFNGSGVSVHSLWRSLEGEWSVDGVVTYRPRETEVAAGLLSLFLGDRLRNLPVLSDWNDSLLFALSRFGDREADLDARGTLAGGVFLLEEGVVANSDARLVARGTALDIPRWETDVRAEIYDAGYAEPLFHVGVVGPLGGVRPFLESGAGLEAARGATAEGAGDAATSSDAGGEVSEAPASEGDADTDTDSDSDSGSGSSTAEEILKRELGNILRDILGGG